MAVSTERLAKAGMVDLVKRVSTISLSKGLDPRRDTAAVVAIFDSSPSNELMPGYGNRNRNYSSGLVQRIGDLVLAAGYTFDDDGTVPVGYFNSGVTTHGVGDICVEDSRGLIERTYRQNWGGGTSYLAALKWIVGQVEEFTQIDLGRPGDPLSIKFRAPMPLFAIFVTDGEPTDDKREILNYIQRISQLPIFIQFVGVGVDNDFSFLNNSLNNMAPHLRLIDNCGFFNAMDVLPRGSYGGNSRRSPEEEIRDQDAVLNALLNEFPAYYRQARQIGLIG